MFKKVKYGNHVFPQPVRKYMKKAHSAKMNIKYPNRVCILHTINKNSHKYMCEICVKW